MATQIIDIGSDFSDVSILQTEDRNTSDITINYSSDVGTIIYDKNLCNDGDNQANPPWKRLAKAPPPGATTILSTETTELDVFFMMINSDIFQHIADVIMYAEEKIRRNPVSKWRGVTDMEGKAYLSMKSRVYCQQCNVAYVLTVSHRTIYK